MKALVGALNKEKEGLLRDCEIFANLRLKLYETRLGIVQINCRVVAQLQLGSGEESAAAAALLLRPRRCREKAGL